MRSKAKKTSTIERRQSTTVQKQSTIVKKQSVIVKTRNRPEKQPNNYAKQFKPRPSNSKHLSNNYSSSPANTTSPATMNKRMNPF